MPFEPWRKYPTINCRDRNAPRGNDRHGRHLLKLSPCSYVIFRAALFLFCVSRFCILSVFLPEARRTLSTRQTPQIGFTLWDLRTIPTVPTVEWMSSRRLWVTVRENLHCLFYGSWARAPKGVYVSSTAAYFIRMPLLEGQTELDMFLYSFSKFICSLR